MTLEPDVARVNDAMNTPGFKYRSFGNEPVRVRPTPVVVEARAAVPVAESLTVAEAMPTVPPHRAEAPEPVMVATAPPAVEAPQPQPQPQPQPPPQPQPQPQPPPPIAMPAPAPAPVQAPVQVHMPVPVPVPDVMPPMVPLVDWSALGVPAAPALPVAAPLAPPPAPSAFAPPTPSLAAPLPPPPAAPSGFALLNDIGKLPPMEPLAREGRQGAQSTLAMLRGNLAGDAGSRLMMASPLLAVSGQFATAPGAAGPAAPLPAAAVTVPLREVMRLLAAGLAPTTSTHDALRAVPRPQTAP